MTDCGHSHNCPSCENDWSCYCTTEACIFDGKMCDGCQLEHLERRDAPPPRFDVTFIDGSSDTFIAADVDDARAWAATCYPKLIIVSIVPTQDPAHA